MFENSPAGLAMLRGEVAVTVTKEENHQGVLSRYRTAVGPVAAELGWCTISGGKYKGQTGVEVLLDGQRVGELTHLMSHRYTPLVSKVLVAGGRPGCEAAVHQGSRGLEVTLRLPRDPESAAALPVLPVRTPPPIPTRRAAVPITPRPAQPAPTAVHQAVPAAAVPAPRRAFLGSYRPAIAAGAIVALAMLIAVVNGGDDTSTPNPGSAADARTVIGTQTTTSAITTTTTAPPTTTTTTMTVAPPPPVTTTVAPPAAAPAAKPTTTAPRTTTAERTTTVAPAPRPETTAAPASRCHPNYSGCVPVASDVDCEGGSGNGPAYVQGPVRVLGADVYGLDHDKDGVGCE